MKVLKRFLVILSVFIAVVFIGLNVFLWLEGKHILEDKFSSALRRVVRIESISFQPPLALKIRQVSIDGISPAESVEIELDLRQLYKRELLVPHVRIVRPVISIEQGADGAIHVFEASGGDGTKIIGTVNTQQVFTPQPNENTPQQNTDIKILVDNLIVEGGIVEFTNSSQEASGAFTVKRARLNNVNIFIQKLSFPLMSDPVNYDLSAVMSIEGSPFSGDVLQSRGWINIIKKDMEGTVKITEPNGKAGLAADLVSKDNDMSVKGSINIPSFRLLASGNDETSSNVNKVVSDTLSSLGVGLGAQFSFQTKMDDFQIKNIAFSGNIITQP